MVIDAAAAPPPSVDAPPPAPVEPVGVVALAAGGAITVHVGDRSQVVDAPSGVHHALDQLGATLPLRPAVDCPTTAPPGDTPTTPPSMGHGAASGYRFDVDGSWRTALVACAGTSDAGMPRVDADPGASSVRTFDTIEQTGGATLAVGGAASPWAFGVPGLRAWWGGTMVVVDEDAIAVRGGTGPDTTIPIAQLDAAALGEALKRSAGATLGPSSHATVIVHGGPIGPVATVLDAVAATGVRAIMVTAAAPDFTTTPGLTITQPEVSAGLDPVIVARYVRRWRGRLVHCYQERLALDHHLAGALTARFTIGGDGLVAASDADGVEPALADCFARTLAAIEFPRPHDGVTAAVTFTFTLAPQAP